MTGFACWWEHFGSEEKELSRKDIARFAWDEAMKEQVQGADFMEGYAIGYKEGCAHQKENDAQMCEALLPNDPNIALLADAIRGNKDPSKNALIKKYQEDDSFADWPDVFKPK